MINFSQLLFLFLIFSTCFFYPKNEKEPLLINQKYYSNNINDEVNIASNREEFINQNQLFLPPNNQNIPIPFYSQKGYLYNYYKNLVANKPSNYDGICGYTAISMFLSYYDNYWNDSFIPNAYEVGQITSYVINGDDGAINYESPGVLDIYIDKDLYTSGLDDIRENYFIGYVNGKKKYTDDFMIAYENAVFEWIEDNIESGTFFGKLLDVALENEIIHRKRNNTEEYLENLGVNYDIVSSILSEYINQCSLSNHINVYNNQVKEEIGITRNMIRNQIISKLSDGVPVIIGGIHYNDENGNGVFDSGDSSNGHVTIAYDYDEENDIIYGNMGWGRNYTHRNLDEYFNLGIMDYYGITIDESLVHTHSNKYHSIDELDNETIVCSCGLNSHIHGYCYRTFNDNKHNRRCICMSSNQLENHLYVSETYIGSHHFAECGFCHFLKNIDDDLVSIV